MPALPGVSLGVEMAVEHLAPAVRGPWLTVSAVCVGRHGPYWDWFVEVCDDAAHEVVGLCAMRFVADLDVQRYQRRLAPKLAARPTRLTWWLRILDAFRLISVMAIPVQMAYVWQGGWISRLVTEAVLVVAWLVALTGFSSAISDWATVRKGVPPMRETQ